MLTAVAAQVDPGALRVIVQDGHQISVELATLQLDHGTDEGETSDDGDEDGDQDEEARFAIMGARSKPDDRKSRRAKSLFQINQV